jgi:hypothetical protein
MSLSEAVLFSTSQNFDDPWSVTQGERILESFSFDESTNPASGLERVAAKLW